MGNENYLQRIYLENKKLDDEFSKLYLGNVSNYDEKNSLSLTVEIAELANETKCFKYWSNKKMDLSKVKLELADCIMMILYRYHELGIKVIEIPKKDIKDDIYSSFNHLFILSTDLFKEVLTDKIDMMLVYTLHIKEILGISDEELEKACYLKMNIVKKRLESDY